MKEKLIGVDCRYLKLVIKKVGRRKLKISAYCVRRKLYPASHWRFCYGFEQKSEVRR